MREHVLSRSGLYVPGRIVEARADLTIRMRAILELLDRQGRPMRGIRGGATGTAMTNYLEDGLLNEVFRATNFVAPTTVYAALFTAAPGEAGGGTEVSTGSYAREAIAFNAPSGGIVANSVDDLFPVATGNWGTITDMAIFDALTTGNMLVYGTLTASKVINTGDQFVFRAGQLTVQFD